jgi:hypothetical protein
VPIADHLVAFATSVRADREANPGIAGDGTALELLIAPRFRSFVETVLNDLGITLGAVWAGPIWPLRVLGSQRAHSVSLNSARTLRRTASKPSAHCATTISRTSRAA